MIIVLYLQLESDIKLLSTFIIASVAFLCADTTFADTIHYPSSEYATIQEAVNAAVDGDVITIAPGTYTENNILIDKSIVIQGSGNQATIIDGNYSNRIFRFEDVKDQSAELRNLYLIRGKTTNYGGAIFCVNSTPTITGCTITSCIAKFGGGIAYYTDENYTNLNSSAFIIDCSISGNSASEFGGGVWGSRLIQITCIDTDVCGNEFDHTDSSPGSDFVGTFVDGGENWIPEWIHASSEYRGYTNCKLLVGPDRAYQTINQAIHDAVDGDVIQIDRGTFNETRIPNDNGQVWLWALDKNDITIQGTLNEDGTIGTIIDGELSGRVFNLTGPLCGSEDTLPKRKYNYHTETQAYSWTMDEPNDCVERGGHWTGYDDDDGDDIPNYLDEYQVGPWQATGYQCTNTRTVVKIDQEQVKHTQGPRIPQHTFKNQGVVIKDLMIKNGRAMGSGELGGQGPAYGCDVWGGEWGSGSGDMTLSGGGMLISHGAGPTISNVV